MGQHAPTIVTGSTDVKRLEALINQLPGNARVSVACRDGKQYSGIVCIRPTIQAFREQKGGKEGLNGVLRLEDSAAPGGEHRIWLDRIDHVQRLDGISGTFAS